MKKIIVIFIGLYSLNAFAYYTENIPNQCGFINNNLLAVFTINKYTCNSGEFLPAYSLGCESCPNDFTCSGGTFVFNENEYQGAEKSSTYITHNMTNMCSTNAYHDLIAVFTPNVHNCNPGYYLPANIDGCTICPMNHYCMGGTFTFNESEPQGIIECPGGSFAPTGSSGCYAHKLHIGNEEIYLRSTKLTTPSLNVAYGDRVFYANATTVPTPITRGSTHYLKVIFNDVEYYICDDFSYQVPTN